MSVVLITYDVNMPGNKRDKLLGYIKSFQEWKKLSESSYAVYRSSGTADHVYSETSKFLDDNDTLIAITLRKPFSGQGSRDVILWLNARLS